MSEMTFGEFIGKCSPVMDSLSASINATRALTPLPPFSRTHLFYLESDEKASSAFNEVKGDLVEWMQPEVKMPFRDIAIVEKSAGPTGFNKTDSRAPGWLCDRLIALEPVELSSPNGPSIKPQCLLWMRSGEFDGVMAPAYGDVFFYIGLKWSEEKKDWRVYGGFQTKESPLYPVSKAASGPLLEIRDKPEIMADNISNMANLLFEVAMISHPMNYVVKVSPKLTEIEERRVRKFGKLPSYKRPHFILVDHEILISMRPKPVGTHASPTPHHRRGCWARLAEHCRHAKLLGKERVWRRPTFVGETTFADASNLYEVLLEPMRRS